MPNPTISDATLRGGVILPEDDATKAAILSAAVDAFSERGFYGTSIRDIGSRSGLSSGSLYNYFADKHSILATVALRSMTALISHTTAAEAAAGLDPTLRLGAVVAAHVEMHAGQANGVIVSGSEIRSLRPETFARVVKLRDQQEALFRGPIADGIASGAFGVPDARYPARFIIAACSEVANWYRSDGPDDLDTVIERYQRMALNVCAGHT